jgi:hypothetical protein
MKPTVCRISVAQDIVVSPEAEVIILGKLVDPVVNTETVMVSAIDSHCFRFNIIYLCFHSINIFHLCNNGIFLDLTRSVSCIH